MPDAAQGDPRGLRLDAAAARPRPPEVAVVRYQALGRSSTSRRCGAAKGRPVAEMALANRLSLT